MKMKMRASFPILLLFALLLFQLTHSKLTESIAKVRVNTRMMTDLLAKNTFSLADPSDEFYHFDYYLMQCWTSISDISLKMGPEYDKAHVHHHPKILSQTEDSITFDLGSMLLEAQGTRYGPDEQYMDFNMKAGFHHVIIKIQIQQQQNKHGEIVPLFKVGQFKLERSEKLEYFSVGTYPTYNPYLFKLGLSIWLDDIIKTKEELFMKKFEQNLQNIVDKFDLSTIALGNAGNKNGQYIEAEFKSQFSYKVSDNFVFDNDMRRNWDAQKNVYASPKVAFNENLDFQRDVQILFDENYINHRFMNEYHHSDSIFSLNDLILDPIYMVLEKVSQHKLTANIHAQYASLQDKGIQMLMEKIMSTKSWAKIYPELKEQKSRPVDFRCTYSRDFGHNSLTEDSTISQVQFHPENVINFNGVYGCGLHIYTGKGSPFVLTPHHTHSQENSGDEDFEEEDELPDDLFLDDEDDVVDYTPPTKEWSTYRGFFYQGEGVVQFDYSSLTQQQRGPLQGIPIDFDWVWGDLVKYENEKEIPIFKEAKNAFKDLFRFFVYYEDIRTITTMVNKVLRLPLTPFVEMEWCMGVKPKNVVTQVNEGYVNMAFDYESVKQTDKSCLNKKHKIGSKSITNQLAFVLYAKIINFPYKTTYKAAKLSFEIGFDYRRKLIKHQYLDEYLQIQAYIADVKGLIKTAQQFKEDFGHLIDTAQYFYQNFEQIQGFVMMVVDKVNYLMNNYEKVQANLLVNPTVLNIARMANIDLDAIN